MSQAIQLELLRPAAPPVSEMDVRVMMDQLRGRGWVTAAELGAKNESEKRVLRAIASASHAQIISGQRGYRLAMEATLPELHASRANFVSQKCELERRITEIDHVIHRHPAPALPEQRGGADDFA